MEHFIYNAYFYTHINIWECVCESAYIHGLYGFRVHSLLYVSLHIIQHNTHTHTLCGMNHGHCHIIAKTFRKRNSLPIVLFFRFSCLSLTITISCSFVHIRSPTLGFTHSRVCSVALSLSRSLPIFLCHGFMLSYFNVWPHTHDTILKKCVYIYNNITPHIQNEWLSNVNPPVVFILFSFKLMFCSLFILLLLSLFFWNQRAYLRMQTARRNGNAKKIGGKFHPK